MKISKQELKELIEELEKHRGRQTELISVYVPAGYDANTVQKQLEAEKSTAKNIKSTATRKNVSDALDKLVRHLKGIKKTPVNGLALFCGNVSKSEGQSDLQLWEIEPPMPLKNRLYRCDKEFVLDSLHTMLEVDKIFALLVMDRKEATIGLLEGKRIELLHKLTSGIPGKVRAGGQSAQRFHRITEGLTKEFYKRISDQMKKIFFDVKKLKGILIGGPIPTKDEFIDGEYLVTQLREKIIGKIDLGDSSESGLKELVERSQDILAEQDIIKEKNYLKLLFETLGKKPDLALLKEEDNRTALERGAVDKLYLSIKLSRSLIKDLTILANNIGSEVIMVSMDTEEGDQFFNMGGIGSILRFSIK